MCIRDSKQTEGSEKDQEAFTNNKESDEEVDAAKNPESEEYKVCLLYTSPTHETSAHLVCRLLLEKKK
ncbi:hypothetical protein JMUB7540_28250 [Staphylococcus aureus]